EHRYSDYKDFGGVKFPTVLHSHQGDPRLNQGHNWMEVRVKSAQPNVTATALAIPDNVRQAMVPPVRVDSQRLANGIWLVAGGSHNSVAVPVPGFVGGVEAAPEEETTPSGVAGVELVRVADADQLLCGHDTN